MKKTRLQNPIWTILSALSLLVFLAASAKAQTPEATDAQKAEILLLERQIDDVEQNLNVAEYELAMASRYQKTGIYVVLPLSVASSILSFYTVAKGDPRGWSALFKKSLPDTTFLTKFSRLFGRASLTIGAGDLIYLTFVNKDQLDKARVKVAFLKVQARNIRSSLELLKNN